VIIEKGKVYGDTGKNIKREFKREVTGERWEGGD
jgi:hypothetical protein